MNSDFGDWQARIIQLGHTLGLWSRGQTTITDQSKNHLAQALSHLEIASRHLEIASRLALPSVPLAPADPDHGD